MVSGSNPDYHAININMGVIKHTKESLMHLKGCVSISEALSKIGVKRNGGNKRLRQLLKEILKEDPNYRGQRIGSVSNKDRLRNEDFFNNVGVKRSSFSVRNALFKRGLKNKQCECCKLSTWEGKDIPLEVHHIDGNKYNNEISNLKILCPNCHYYTDTYKTKNRNIVNR